MTDNNELGGLEPSIVISQVDEFIRQLHNGDIELTKQAQTLTEFTQTKSTFGFTKQEREGSLADLIGKAIAKY